MMPETGMPPQQMAPAQAAPAPEPIKLNPDRKKARKGTKSKNYRSIMMQGYGTWIRRLPLFDFRTIDEMLKDDMIRLCMAMRVAPISSISFEYEDLQNGQWVPGVRASHETIGLFVLRQMKTIWRYLECITDAQKYGWSAGEIVLKDTRYGTVEIDKLLPRRAIDSQVLVRGGFPVGVRIKGTEHGYCDLMYPYCWWHSYDPLPGSNYGQSVLYAAQSPWWDKWQEGGALDTQRLFMHTNAFGGVDVAYPAGKTHIDGRGIVDNYEIAYDIATQLRTGSVTTRPSERDDKGNEKWSITRGTIASNPQHIHEYPDTCDERIRKALGVPDDVITSDGGTGAWAGKRIPLTAFYCSLDTWVGKLLRDLYPVLEALVELNFGKGHWFELSHKPMAEEANEQQGGGGAPPPGGADPMDPMGGMGMGGSQGMEQGFDDPSGGEVDPAMMRMSLSIEDEDGEDSEKKARLIVDILQSIYGDKAEKVLEKLLGTQRMATWNSDDHPRGPNGRFIVKGSAEGYEAAASAVAHVRRNRKDPEARNQLMSHLKNLTIKQLTKLKKANGVKASGKVKESLVRKLAERLGSYKHSTAERDDESPVAPHGDQVYAVPTKSLKIDPSRFQYKVQGIRADGVTDEMREVGTWNPNLGGVLLAWRDPDTGEDFIVNGHHRYELANRMKQDILNVRYIEADNAKEARAQGALANIAEGRGTAVDAAKFLRDSGYSIQDLKEEGVSLKGKVAEEASILQSLSDRTFQRVTNGMIEKDTAVAVARHLKDHGLQDKLFKKIADREENNLNWSPKQIERASLKMANAGKVTESVESLFGNWDSEESTFDQEVEIEEFVSRKLATQKNDYAAVANAKRAGRVADAGNVLAVDENARRKTDAENTLATFEREAGLKGDVSAKVKDMAAELAKAKTKSQKEEIKERSYREIVKAMAGPQPETDIAPGPVEFVESAKSIFAESNRRYLDIPFKHSEAAKEMGAHWDAKKKRWFSFSEEGAGRINDLISGATYDRAIADADPTMRAKLENYAETFGKHSKMVSLAADEVANKKRAAPPMAKDSPGPLVSLDEDPPMPLMWEDQIPDDWQGTPAKIRMTAKLLMDEGESIPEEAWNDTERLKSEVQRAINRKKRPSGLEKTYSGMQDKARQLETTYQNALKNTPHNAHVAKDDLDKHMRAQEEIGRAIGVPGAQQLLFDRGRKSDAPGQTLMFEDENQQPREAPPLVSRSTAASIMSEAQSKYREFRQEGERHDPKSPSAYAEQKQRDFIARRAIESASELSEDDFLSLMQRGDGRKDMAFGNAVKLLGRATGLGDGKRAREKANELLKDSSPTRFTQQHYKSENPIANASGNQTSGVYADTKMISAGDVFRAIWKAASESSKPGKRSLDDMLAGKANQ